MTQAYVIQEGASNWPQIGILLWTSDMSAKVDPGCLRLGESQVALQVRAPWTFDPGTVIGFLLAWPLPPLSSITGGQFYELLGVSVCG